MKKEIKKCAFCKAEILRDKYTNKNVFCTRQCSLLFKDNKQANILNTKNENDFHYLLGLIATDGYISKKESKKSQRCNISLHKNDEQVLLDIQKKYGGKIYKFYKANKNVVRWQILNQKFICFVESTGICNSKSLTLDIQKWFKTLNKQQKLSFIHGVIDGDGSISFSVVKNTFRSNIIIVGASFEFMKMLFDEMKLLNINCTFADRTKTTKTWHIIISGRKILSALPIFTIENQKLNVSRKMKNYFTCYNYYTNNKPLQNRLRYPSIQ